MNHFPSMGRELCCPPDGCKSKKSRQEKISSLQKKQRFPSGAVYPAGPTSHDSLFSSSTHTPAYSPYARIKLPRQILYHHEHILSLPCPTPLPPISSIYVETHTFLLQVDVYRRWQIIPHSLDHQAVRLAFFPVLETGRSLKGRQKALTQFYYSQWRNICLPLLP